MDRPLSLRPRSGDEDIRPAPAPATTSDKPPDHEAHDPRPGTSERRDGGTTPHLACFHLAGRAGMVPEMARAIWAWRYRVRPPRSGEGG
jgi:hypothetical protein